MSTTALNLFSEGLNYQDIEFFEEAKKGGGKQYAFEGIFAQADVINGNRRVYPSKILMPAVERYIEDRVNRKLSMGELDHPETLTVNMKNVSHLIKELRVEGSNVFGKAVITDTPCGQIAEGLARSGVQLGVSTRGGGKAAKKSGYQEMTMYVMTAVDIVSYPSAPDAFVNGVKENAEFFVESGMISMETADELTNTNSTMTSDELRYMVRKISLELEGNIK